MGSPEQPDGREAVVDEIVTMTLAELGYRTDMAHVTHLDIPNAVRAAVKNSYNVMNPPTAQEEGEA
ncbi:hypothetical protein BH09PAT3_BH09PAT3_3660 [soil metagenome]